MVLYAEQLAWLDAKPGKSTVSRRDMNDNPALPPVSYGLKLIRYLGCIGEVTHKEIIAWSRDYHPPIQIDRWEAEAMIKISRAYESMSHKATKSECLAPYMTSDSSLAHLDAQWAMMKASVPEGMAGMPMAQGTVNG